MIRAVHYTERITGGGVTPRYLKHTLAFKVFRRYLVITWVWTA